MKKSGRRGGRRRRKKPFEGKELGLGEGVYSSWKLGRGGEEKKKKKKKKDSGEGGVKPFEISLS